mgnify:CR=1 FL=1
MRWVAVFPAGLTAAVLVMFPIHWAIIMTSFGETPFFLSLLSARTVESLMIAFTTPFFVIYVGVLTAPTQDRDRGCTRYHHGTDHGRCICPCLYWWCPVQRLGFTLLRSYTCFKLGGNGACPLQNTAPLPTSEFSALDRPSAFVTKEV